MKCHELHRVLAAKQKYSPATNDTYGIYIKRFLSWLKDEDISSEAFTYNDLLEFTRYCNNRGTTKCTVHNILLLSGIIAIG